MRKVSENTKNTSFFDVETIVEEEQISISDQDSYPEAIFFSSNGNRMFVLGLSQKRIYSYTMSTPWNLTTASYENVCFHVGNQVRGPKTLFFSSNGTRMFVLGDDNTIYSYDLTCPWNLSTANYNNEKFDVSRFGKKFIVEMFFSSNGTKLFVLDRYENRVYSCTLKNSWNVSSAIHDEKFLHVNDTGIFLKGLFFDPEGTKMFLIGSYDKIFSYELSVPWDISTAKYDTFFHGNTKLKPHSLFFSPNGKKMYVLNWKNRKVHSFSLKNAYEFGSSPVKEHVREIDNPNIPKGIFFNSTGTKMFVSGDNNRVYRYTLEIPWEISTAKNDNVFFDVSRRNVEKIDPTGMFFSSNGKKLFIVENSGNTIFSFGLRISWNIATASHDFEFLDASSMNTNLQGIFFRSDGRKLFVVGKDENRICSYTLSIPWDITTAIPDSSNFSTSSYDRNPGGVFFNSRGTMMYLLGRDNERIFSFELTSSWNLSSSTAICKESFPICNPGPLQAMYFDKTGKSMHVLNRNMYSRYELSSPWKISTASLRHTQPVEGISMFLQNNGKRLFILNGRILSSHLLEK
jgi:DNA-binding beta-propeller fold protein YncE